MQSQEFVDVGGTILPVTANAGRIDAVGAELEFAWAPTPTFQLRTAADLTHAEFEDYIVTNPFELGDDASLEASGHLNLSGSEVPLAPSFTLSFFAEYTCYLKNSTLLRPYILSYYSDNYWTNDVNAPVLGRTPIQRRMLIWSGAVRLAVGRWQHLLRI